MTPLRRLPKGLALALCALALLALPAAGAEDAPVAVPAVVPGVEPAAAPPPNPGPRPSPSAPAEKDEERARVGAEGETGPEPPPAESAEPRPAGILPVFLRSLLPIEVGRNDRTPRWAPGGDLLSFERSSGEQKEILLASAEGGILQRVYLQPAEASGSGVDLIFPGLFEEASYNAGLTFSPEGRRFVFMSNAGGGNYDLYLGERGGEGSLRLTDDPEKDGHPDWSPAGDRLVFVSGRTGRAELFLLDLATRALTPLTGGKDSGKAYLYPQWSPDGGRLAVMYGGNENHDIWLLEGPGTPGQRLRPLSRWPGDEIRPAWSPDGRKVAFYTNHNADNDPRIWSLAVAWADPDDPGGAEGQARVVARDVIPDVERGPAWLPDSRGLVYIRDDRHAYNPLHVVDLEGGNDLPLLTDTRMNHDVTCSADWVLAFRAQVEQWDQIFLATLPRPQEPATTER